MTVQTWRNYFTRREDAIAHVTEAGLYLYEVDLRPLDPDVVPHTHDYDTHFYVLDGTIELHDVDSGQVHKHGAGTKIVMSRGTSHFGVHGGYSAVIGLTIDPNALTRGE